MIVEQIWTANSGRNFNYLIACGETGEALAVDPLDHAKCLAAAKAKGWTITLRLGRCQAFRVVERIDRQRLAGLAAGDQVVEIATGIGGPDLFDDHRMLPACSTAQSIGSGPARRHPQH